MLTKLEQRGYLVQEARIKYLPNGVDSDSDPDSDPEKNQTTV